MDDDYLVKLAAEVRVHPRTNKFLQARDLLEEEGISFLPIEKASAAVGDEMVANLAHAVIEPLARVAVTGVCLPAEVSLQTLLPLIVTKRLIDAGAIDKAYIPLPVAAYAAVGLPRFEAFAKTLTYLGKLFGEDAIGESVIPVPDYAIAEERSLVSILCAPEIGEGPSREKYQFGNLYGAVETAGYGADVALPAAAERQAVTVIADFKQFESIHAGKKSARKLGKSMGLDAGAIVLTTLTPEFEKNLLHEEMAMSRAEILDMKAAPELHPAFLAAVMDFLDTSSHISAEAYEDIVKRGKKPTAFLSIGSSLLAGFYGELDNFRKSRPASSLRISFVESKTRERFGSLKEKLHILLRRRMENKDVSSSLIIGSEFK